MKICFVLDDGLDRPDGVQQYILTLGSWFASKGHEVHYMVGETERKDIPNLHVLARNIRVRFNKNRLAMPLFASKKAIAELLVKEQFDVVHVQMPYSPQFAARVIARVPARTAVIGTFHILPTGGLQHLGARALSLLTLSTTRRIDAVYSVSPAAQFFAENSMKIKSEVLPNAVDLSLFAAGKKLKRYTKKTNVVFLGRLVERKGAMELIKAVNNLIKTDRFEGRQLILGGSGPLESKIRRYCLKHGINDSIIMLGHVAEKDKKDLFATADLVVLPSKYGESFGIVVVEAIASGARLVLGGDNPGYRYVLNNEEDALIDPRDVMAFSDRIDRLLTDETLAKKLQKEQREFIRRFDVERVGDSLLKSYKSVLAKKQISFDNNTHE